MLGCPLKEKIVQQMLHLRHGQRGMTELDPASGAVGVSGQYVGTVTRRERDYVNPPMSVQVWAKNLGPVLELLSHQ